jgi:WD40 repeat protein
VGAAQAAEKPARVDRHGDPLPEGAVARLGTLRWRAATGYPLLFFTPDGKTVVAATGQQVRYFDPDGRATRQVPVDVLNLTGLRHSPDGSQLASSHVPEMGRYAGKLVVQVWDLHEAGQPREFPLETDRRDSPWVGWSASGDPLAVYKAGNALVCRELATGKVRSLELEKGLKSHSLSLLDAAYAPTGSLLAARDHQTGTLYVWEVGTGRLRCTLPRKNSRVLSLRISPDGRTLVWVDATLENKRAVHLWDLTTGRVRDDLAGDQKDPDSVLFSPDGKTLAVVGGSEIRFRDTATGRERSRIRDSRSWSRERPNYPDPNRFAFSPDGRTLAGVSGVSTALRLWDVATGVPRPAPVGHTSHTYRIAWSPDSTTVYSTEFTGTTLGWDPRTGRPLTGFGLAGGRWPAALSSDGRAIFCSRFNDGMVDVADALTGQTLYELKVEDPDHPKAEQRLHHLHLSADGRTLVALSAFDLERGENGSEGTLVTGWDTATRKVVFRRRRLPIAIWPVLSPDARTVALPHPEAESRPGGPLVPGMGPVHLEHLATGERLLDLPEIKGQTLPLVFSADGRLLATHSAWYGSAQEGASPPDGRLAVVRVWELASGREVLTLTTAKDGSGNTAFSPDGRLLALEGPDRDVRLWDLRRLREIRVFRCDLVVTRLAFSPDGRRLVTGLADSTLLVWDTTLPRAAQVAPPDAATLNRAWADLAGDAKKAFVARGALAQWPSEMVAFLKERLQPTRSADPALPRQLIAELDSERFATRTKAQANLEELGERASAALREALGRKPSLEARRRLEALLARQRDPIRDTETLRAVRAIAVLEDIGTPKARSVLKTLAGGLVDTRQTQEARKALERTSR